MAEVDCVMSNWGSWTDCGAMSAGQKTRRRSIEQPALNGGASCLHLVDHGTCPGKISSFFHLIKVHVILIIFSPF